jgi:hypothetical protein
MLFSFRNTSKLFTDLLKMQLHYRQFANFEKKTNVSVYDFRWQPGEAASMTQCTYCTAFLDHQTHCHYINAIIFVFTFGFRTKKNIATLSRKIKKQFSNQTVRLWTSDVHSWREPFFSVSAREKNV